MRETGEGHASAARMAAHATPCLSPNIIEVINNHNGWLSSAAVARHRCAARRTRQRRYVTATATSLRQCVIERVKDAPGTGSLVEGISRI